MVFPFFSPENLEFIIMKANYRHLCFVSSSNVKLIHKICMLNIQFGIWNVNNLLKPNGNRSFEYVC